MVVGINGEMNMNDILKYKCDNCGQEYVFKGKEAWILYNIEQALWELRGFRFENNNEAFVPGVPYIIQYDAKCCDKPKIRHTFDDDKLYTDKHGDGK